MKLIESDLFNNYYKLSKMVEEGCDSDVSNYLWSNVKWPIRIRLRILGLIQFQFK